MKTVNKVGGLLVIAMALLASFAFTGENPDPSLKLFANTPTGWVDITGQSYDCDVLEDICVAQFRNDNPQGQMVYSEPGEYIALP